MGAIALAPILYFFKPNPLFEGKKSIFTFLCEAFQLSRIFVLFKHHKNCKNCSMNKICPGIPKEMIKNSNFQTLPYSKDEYPKIINPVFFGQFLKNKFKSFKN